jgi:hypothetical protein
VPLGTTSGSSSIAWKAALLGTNLERAWTVKARGPIGKARTRAMPLEVRSVGHCRAC